MKTKENKLTFRKIYNHKGNSYYLYLDGKRQDRYFIEICIYHMDDEEETQYTEYNVFDNKLTNDYSFSDLRKAKDKLVYIFNRDKGNQIV